MATKKASASAHAENAAAALESLETAANLTAKAHGVLAGRVEALTEEVADLETKLSAAVAQHAAEVARLKQSYTAEIAGLTSKVQAHEETIRRVRGHVS